MKIFQTLLLLFVTCLSLSTAVVAQSYQVSNVDGAAYQRAFDEAVRNGFRPVKITSKTQQVIDYQPGETPQFAYWATFEKRNDGVAWASHHGLNAAQYQQQFDNWTRQGYMPVDVCVASIGNDTRYSVIFEKLSNTPAWYARHNMNYTQIIQFERSIASQGFRRQALSIAFNRMAAGIWVR